MFLRIPLREQQGNSDALNIVKCKGDLIDFWAPPASGQAGGVAAHPCPGRGEGGGEGEEGEGGAGAPLPLGRFPKLTGTGMGYTPARWRDIDVKNDFFTWIFQLNSGSRQPN